MNRHFFSFLLIMLPFAGIAQVGVGTNNVDPSAKFQIESTNKGFLQPRVALTGTNDVTTIANPATGLMVFNTATAGSGATAITPGVHYFDGTKWVRTESSVINAGTGTSVTGSGTSANPYVINSIGGGTPVTFVSGTFQDNGTDFDGARQYTLTGSIVYGPSFRIGRITLPEGKWEVNLHTETWMRTSGGVGGSCRVKMQFWIQNDQTDNQMLFSSGAQASILNLPGTIYNNQTAAGYPPIGGGDALVPGSAAFTFSLNTGAANNSNTYCKGSFLINNTTASKTYYVYASEMFDGCVPSGPTGSMPTYFFIKNGQYSSNRLFATKIN